MLTIGQLAGYVGVSVRTVRHYHQIGLLPEPERDSSGYRSYDSSHVVTLTRIRTLAAAGVPLRRIEELLATTPEQFQGALAELDAQVEQKLRQLQDLRRRMAQLPSPDDLCVPASGARLFERLRELGLGERMMEFERDSLVLCYALFPEQAESVVEFRMRLLDDEGYRRFLHLFEGCMDWDPDDPRIEPMVQEIVRTLTRLYPIEEAERDARRFEDDFSDTTAWTMVNEHGMEFSPAWRRINTLVEQAVVAEGYPVPDERQ